MDYYEYARSRDLERLARQLDKHCDFKVLRRLPRPDELWLSPTPAKGPMVRLAVIDVETTGLDSKRARMIELAIVHLELDEVGNVIQLQPVTEQLEAPGVSLPSEVEALIGIEAQMLVEQRFYDRLIHNLLSVDVIVSHNATFDRTFMCTRFPRPC